MRTTDLWLAAYLYNLDPTRLSGIHKSGSKMQFQFDYTSDEWTQHKLAFIKSDVANIKYIIEKLKDLAFQ